MSFAERIVVNTSSALINRISQNSVEMWRVDYRKKSLDFCDNPDHVTLAFGSG